jgi:preprotein translocase subunit YajC
MTQLLVILVVFVIFYFLLIRPQQKRVREHQKLVSELKNGDEVVTIGGVHGKILDLDEETVSLEVAENVAITVSRQAVSRRK